MWINMYGITCAVTLKEKTFDWNKIKQKHKQKKTKTQTTPPQKKQTKKPVTAIKIN